MLLIGCGFCMVFASIIIPALTGIPNKHNVNETLSLSPSQASWLGKKFKKTFILMKSMRWSESLNNLDFSRFFAVHGIFRIFVWFSWYSAVL